MVIQVHFQLIRIPKQVIRVPKSYKYNSECEYYSTHAHPAISKVKSTPLNHDLNPLILSQELDIDLRATAFISGF